MSAAFEALNVLDLSDRLSGAFAARLFGDFGAEVTLAEPPDGHPLRYEPPFFDDEPGPERSVAHAFANWNKRSRIVSTPEALAALVAAADVVVTSHSPIKNACLGQLDILPALSSLRPDAVHLSVTPHGLSGSRSASPGNNLTACARTGWSFVNRHLDEPPLQLPRDQAGYVGGVTGFLTAAAALRRRYATPDPEVVDVSEVEALALTVHPWGISAIYNQLGASNAAGARPRGAPGPLWDLSDGRMHFAIADFHHWPEAMAALGLPDLGTCPDLIPDLGRHSKDLTDVGAGLARSLPNLECWPVFEKLAELRCVVGVMQTTEELPDNPQLRAREFFVEAEIDGRPVKAPGAPAKLTPSAWRLSRPAPRLGEQRDQEPAPPIAPVRAPTLPVGSMAEGPLSGVRVLSFGQAWSGTFGTELLALLGADVVQVGSRHRPDVWRRVSDKVPAGVADPSRAQHPLNTQGLYNAVNLHKREICLDLRHARGRELLWQLFPSFDVVVDNFRPTVMPGWGVTLERLNALRPGVVWASVSGYGSTGPYSAYPANGSTTEAMSGLSSIHGYAGDSGMNTGGLFPDPMSGYFLAASVLAALDARDRTGEAQRIDLSMMEAVNVLCGEAVMELGATGRFPRPRGNRHPRLAPHGCYATRPRLLDGVAQPVEACWLAISVEDEAAWRALIAHIGDPRLSRPQFATMAGRKANEDDLDALIGSWCARQDAQEADQTLCASGIAAARIVPLYELYSSPDPNFVASGFVTQVDHPEVGPTWLPGRPWRFSGAPASPVRAAPCVGQHSHEILVGELGVTEVEYAELVAAGVTGTLVGG
jgi:crotonobetainyl-CoA:carnitine CoA-transferase CaiB-like acyl-CoA transferase